MYFPDMQRVYDRLGQLAGKEILTEAERIEEQYLARTFLDMRGLQAFLENGPPWASGTHEEAASNALKRRIITAAHYQTAAGEVVQ